MVPDQMPCLGLQLYTVRDAVAEDLEAALRRVVRAGYLGVETMGTYGLTPGDLAGALVAAGLEWVSAFVAFHDPASFAVELDALAAAGCGAVVIPFAPPESFADRDGIERLATVLSEATAVGAERSIAVGYHNHTWEVADVDGRPALARLFDAVDPRTFAEVDVYWVQVAGVDPAEFVAGLGDRARILHVKDGPGVDRDQAMVAVGAGALDVARVLGAAEHAEWHVVELDRCDGDVWAAVEQSARFLVDGGWSRGRD